MFYKLHYEKINDEINDLVNKKNRFAESLNHSSCYFLKELTHMELY